MKMGNLYFTPYTKLNPSWISDIHVNAEIQLLELNKGEYIQTSEEVKIYTNRKH